MSSEKEKVTGPSPDQSQDRDTLPDDALPFACPCKEAKLCSDCGKLAFSPNVDHVPISFSSALNRIQGGFWGYAISAAVIILVVSLFFSGVLSNIDGKDPKDPGKNPLGLDVITALITSFVGLYTFLSSPASMERLRENTREPIRTASLAGLFLSLTVGLGFEWSSVFTYKLFDDNPSSVPEFHRDRITRGNIVYTLSVFLLAMAGALVHGGLKRWGAERLLALKNEPKAFAELFGVSRRLQGSFGPAADLVQKIVNKSPRKFRKCQKEPVPSEAVLKKLNSSKRWSIGRAIFFELIILVAACVCLTLVASPEPIGINLLAALGILSAVVFGAYFAVRTTFETAFLHSKGQQDRSTTWFLTGMCLLVAIAYSLLSISLLGVTSLIGILVPLAASLAIYFKSTHSAWKAWRASGKKRKTLETNNAAEQYFPQSDYIELATMAARDWNVPGHVAPDSVRELEILALLDNFQYPWITIRSHGGTRRAFWVSQNKQTKTSFWNFHKGRLEKIAACSMMRLTYHLVGRINEDIELRAVDYKDEQNTSKMARLVIVQFTSN
ncbi:hypothetical protein [Corynebacterium sp. p3-SID1241]|uniref:hypothetical protein n=1 Tax=Corynebacterium sp. p3-SID1241 TaxID=2916102 RepID=UPI0021A8820D|nr:hypothetical protein [Corynebacterium sp. p3-SID1241]MCT1428018.1 hypothetical protein [Corynebacterium sp. p3-SID1241]